MFYWLPETRKLVWMAIVALVIWLVIENPVSAGGDVAHVFHLLEWGLGRLGKFAESI